MEIIFIIAALVLLILSFGILSNRREKNIRENSFSILIACRNEEGNIPHLFQSLEKLNYPKDKYEIILADDASSDNTLNMIKEFCYRQQNADYVNLEKKDKEYRGKKAALKKAAEIAKNEFLAFTDADCRIPADWLNGYNNYISDKTGMIAGFYLETGKSAFSTFSRKFSSAVFAASIGLKNPFSCVGSNMVIRKQTFTDISGFDRIKSYPAGNDKLILNLIRQTKWRIMYNPENPVFTSRLESFKSRFEQNKRRYGKFSYSSFYYQMISLLILLFYLYLPLQLYISRRFSEVLPYYLMMTVFWCSNLYLHRQKLRITDLFFLVIYPYYVIFFSIYGHFRKWNWKDQINRKQS